MADRETPADAPTVDETSDGDSLLREIAAAPSVDVPVELATMVLLEPGTVVDGKFRIEERLGAGGMGVVYAAHDLALGREVAIKLMRLERSIGRLGEKLPEVFDREARATARLNHPNIVTLHQFGNWNGIVYLVLERLRGETLGAKLERGRVPLLDALEIMEHVATALVHTHAAGVIHRDLKPQNVFLLADGGVKVLDFGVSGLGLMGPVPETAEPSPRTTLAHAGTPGYMAPEQWRGEPQDARTDLWAIGVMLYQLVTNALPFGLRGAPHNVDLAPLSAKLPTEAKELVALVEKCVAIRREDRAADAAEVARALHAIRTRLDPRLAPAVQRRSLGSRLARGGIAVASVLAITGATVALWPDPPGAHCDAAAEKQLAGIWDANTRARLGSTFAKAGPHGEATWTAVAMTLDRYSHEWVAMHAQACRAANATTPPITQCLMERRDQLARFIHDHESVTADQVLATLGAAQALSPVSDCGDPSYLVRWTPGAASSQWNESGLVRGAITVNGSVLDVVHSATPVGDDIVAAGIASNGAMIAGNPIANGFFIARITRKGALTWSDVNPSAKVIEVAPGASGDVLVGGFYAAATTFAGTSLPAPSGSGDCFAAAIDVATGKARWAIVIGASDDCATRAVASDPDGNVYLAGEFGGHARFGGTRDIDAAARPTKAPFVASWSASGTLRWVTPGRGTGSAMSKGLAIDGDGVAFGTRISGAGWLGDRELNAGGCVVALLDRAHGSIRWLRELAIAQCELQAVAMHDERVAAVGRHRGRGAWIQELNVADGSDRWQTFIGTHDQESATSAAYIAGGPLTVTGFFGGPSLAIGSHTLTGKGLNDGFVAGFDEAGHVLGALSFGGTGFDRPRWIGQGRTGTAFLAGRFSNTMLIDGRELRAAADQDGMLLELALPWQPNAGAH
jgi:hypothetical protein